MEQVRAAFLMKSVISAAIVRYSVEYAIYNTCQRMQMKPTTPRLNLFALVGAFAKRLSIGMVCVVSLALSGCAEMISTTTQDEIRASTFQREFSSPRPAADVSNCMKEALQSYRSDRGTSSYAGITFRDFEKTHDITLRTPGATTLAGNEILFFIENTARPDGGTNSHLWTHPHLMSNGGSQGFIDRVSGAIQPCFGSAAAPRIEAPVQQIDAGPRPAAATGSKDVSVEKLDQLKGLLDRGVITNAEFDKKKKEILDRF